MEGLVADAHSTRVRQRRRLRSLVAALMVGILTGVMVGPASATVSTPAPSVALPVALDTPSFYEAQTLCDPTPRPGALALRDLLVRTYGPATVYLSRACSSSVSEHFDGRAVDWMRDSRVPAQKEMADAFVDWLLAPAADGTPHAMARRLGIMYIIWNSRMIRMYDPGRGWTNYRNCQDAANASSSLDTGCHRNHVHLSMSWDGAAGVTSWWSGTAQTLPYCRAGSTSATPTAGTAQVVDPANLPTLVPVTTATVLDSAVGVGVTAACRVLAGRSDYPNVVVSGAPAGATWAVITATSASNAPGDLIAWSAGGTLPKSLLVTPIGSTTGTLAVPIASDGTIGIGTTLGASRISLQVIGYLMADPSTTPTPTPSPTSTAPVVGPSKPRGVTAISHKKRTVTVKWTEPETTGSAEITKYRARALVSSQKGAKVAAACIGSPTDRKCRIKGLRRGAKYWISVSVRTSVGASWANREPVRVR